MKAQKSYFFKGVPQIETTLCGSPVKFPVFYYDASAIIAIFLARLSKLKEILPKKNYFPLSPFPGLGLLAIAAFEYRDCDLGPYNELAISLLISFREKPRFSLGKLKSNLSRKEFHTYIAHLPVTTEMARVGGVEFYNFPKFLADIRFKESRAKIGVELKEKGKLILRLIAEKCPARKSGVMRAVTYPVKERKAHEAPVLMNALSWGETFRPKGKLTPGEDHPIAAQLEELLVSQKPIYLQWIPKFQAILYGASRLE